MSSYLIEKVSLLFLAFCIRFCFPQPFSCSFLLSLCLFKCYTCLTLVFIKEGVLLEEEVFDVLILNIFAFGEDVEDR